MSGLVQQNTSVEPREKERFKEACEIEGRSMREVIREFMQQYADNVLKSRARKGR